MNLRNLYIILMFFKLVFSHKIKYNKINKVISYKCKDVDNKNCNIKTTTTEYYMPSNLIQNFDK